MMKINSNIIKMSVFLILLAPQISHADGPMTAVWSWMTAPVRWATGVVDHALGYRESPKGGSAGGGSAVNVTVNNNLPVSQKSVEMQKYEADLEKIKAEATQRLAEVNAVEGVMQRQSTLPFYINVNTLKVRGKELIAEDDTSKAQAACHVKMQDELILLMNTGKQGKDFKNLMETLNITTIDMSLLDNQSSARSDKLFAIGSDLNIGDVESENKKTITSYKIPDELYTSLKNSLVNLDTDPINTQIEVSKIFEKNKINYSVRKLIIDSVNAKKKMIISDTNNLCDPALGLSSGCKSETKSTVVRGPGSLKVYGFLDHAGKCVSLKNELVAEMTLMLHDKRLKTNPESFKSFNITDYYNSDAFIDGGENVANVISANESVYDGYMKNLSFSSGKEIKKNISEKQNSIK